MSWQDIQPKIRPLFSESLTDLSKRVQGTLDDDKKTASEPTQRLTEEELETTFGTVEFYFNSTIVPVIEELNLLVPNVNDPAQLRKFTECMTYLSSLPVDFFGKPVEGSNKDQPSIIVSIRRKATALSTLLNDLIADPVDQILAGVSQEYYESTKDKTERAINLTIAEFNTELLKSTNFPKAEKKRPARDMARISASVLGTAVDKTDQQMQISAPEDSHDSLGTIDIKADWLTGQEEKSRPISQLTAFGKTVYIIDAVDKNLSVLSDDCRVNLPTNEFGEDCFEAATTQEARRIASDIMPWTSTNSVKSLDKAGSKTPAEYSGTPIWYTFDISPNAPRVYFTIKKLGDIIDQTKPTKLDRDSWVMVVMARTDKSNQTTVLKQFTGRAHNTLRANGSGSK